MQAAAISLALVLLLGGASAVPGDDMLFTQVQFLGTYQSYHQAPPQAIIDLLNQPSYQAGLASEGLNVPQDYLFSHLTLTEMLNAGMRGFEIDTLDDPMAGQYAYSAGLKLAGQNSLVSSDLLQPGIKVMSSPDFDFGSSCYLFIKCLTEIAEFSVANPDHFPITIFIHHGDLAKADSLLGNAYNSSLQQLQASDMQPMNFSNGTHAKLSDVEEEILMVFNRSQLYTPDDLRMDNGASMDAALRDIVLSGAVLNGSWPTIGRLRNKIVFIADPDYYDELGALHPNSSESLLWLADDQGDQDPNVVILDAYVDVDITNTSATQKPLPILSNADDYVTASAFGQQSISLQGFFIRGGADSSSVAALYNYTLQRDLTTTVGGPQFIATFYETLAPAALGPSNYTANPATVPGFNGAEAICNPVTTTQGRVTSGSAAFPFDGAIPQLGGASIIQNPANCSVPQGFSPGMYLQQPAAPTPAASAGA